MPRWKSAGPRRPPPPHRCRMPWQRRMAKAFGRSGPARGLNLIHGLTGSPRPLYSAGFATSAFRLTSDGPCGGIGRRARLKIEFRKECWFDSGQGHQLGCSSPFQSVRNRPRSARKPLKNRHFRVHQCSSPFVLVRSQPSDLLAFLLVSCWYRENKRSRRISLFRTRELSRWPARTMARAPTPSR